MEYPFLFYHSYPYLWRIFLGPRYRNSVLYGLIIFFNLCAAILEGGSFALLLGAFSAISNADFSQSNFLMGSYLLSLSERMSVATLFLFLIAMAVFLQGLRTVISGLAICFNTRTTLLIQSELQKSIYKNIFNFSFSCVSNFKIGDLTEYTKTPSAVLNTFMDNLNRFVVSLSMVLVILFIMFSLDFSLTFFTLFLFVVAAFSQKFILSKIGHSAEQLSDSIVECSKQTTQAFQAIRVIHTYNRQFHVLEKISIILDEIIRISKKVCFMANFVPAINELIGTLLVTAILMSGFYFLSGDDKQILPILLTFLALTHRLAIRMQIMSSCASNIALQKGGILRLEQILSDKEKEWVQSGTQKFLGLKSEVSFEKISLYYPSNQKLALNDLTLTIQKGKITAIVGKSGAGKSSILDLLLGLYKPSGGVIRIDGIDLSKFSLGSWRNILGVVSQDVAIFNDTIKENICFGLTEVDDAKITQVILSSGLGPFIDTLPERLETVVGERGFRLSGGQRQRVALARALIRDPQILILDEATSSLDSHSEMLIQTALEEFRADRTVLVVAHRLSTIKNADFIYVIDDGKVIEKGDHLSLIGQNGAYAQFWKLQRDESSPIPVLA